MSFKTTSRFNVLAFFGISACFAFCAPALAADGCGRFHRFSYRLQRCVILGDLSPRLLPAAPGYRPGSVRLAPSFPPGNPIVSPRYRRYRHPARPFIRVHSPLIRISL